VIAGFQGEPGAFSELAIRALLGEVSMRGYGTFAGVLDALEGEQIHYAVLPFENTLHGPITAVNELIAARDSLRVAGETWIAVEQCLIGMPDVTFEEIDTVTSHPVALTQCRRFLHEHSGWHVIETSDTAGAVREMMERGRRATAAIAAAHAAERYGARLLLRSIQDDPQNITRFWLITRDG
jgi:prephenate dehydratase